MQTYFFTKEIILKTASGAYESIYVGGGAQNQAIPLNTVVHVSFKG